LEEGLIHLQYIAAIWELAHHLPHKLGLLELFVGASPDLGKLVFESLFISW